MTDYIEKLFEIERCSVIAFTPLTHGDAEAARHILRVFSEQIISQKMAEIAKTDPDDKIKKLAEKSIALLKEYDDKRMKLIQEKFGAESDNILITRLTLLFAKAFNEVMELGAADNPADETEKIKLCGKLKDDLLAYRKQCSPDLRSTIEDAGKWVDAAIMIATSDKKITAEGAFNSISLSR